MGTNVDERRCGGCRWFMPLGSMSAVHAEAGLVDLCLVGPEPAWVTPARSCEKWSGAEPKPPADPESDDSYRERLLQIIGEHSVNTQHAKIARGRELDALGAVYQTSRR